MASMLSSFFQRDPKSQFAFDLPNTAEHTLHDGIHLGNSFKKAEPEELATVLWASGADASKLKAQSQKLKTMRHPNIITYQDSIEVDNTFYLVTEKCRPLCQYLDSANFSASQKEFVVSWGIFQVLNCLKFLHEASLSHENVREAIYVTAGGDWKLANLQGVSAFTSPQHDLNQLAIVIWEVFNGFNKGFSKPNAPGKIPQRLTDFYKKIATPAAARQNAGELIRDLRLPSGFFKNKYVDTLLFLEEFQLKESNEKQGFFMHLRENLDIFPDDIAKYKILPKLIQTYEYGDAGPNILIPLFKLGRLLAEDEYQRRIVPCLVKLFSSSDRTTRVKLLERIDEFGQNLTPQVINDKIFGNLVTGFLDTSPAVRESTVKAMVVLAEKLNFHNLNVELMKYLARLQGGDEHGGIRTNTTICLGKIGCYLDPSKRQSILLGAFTRGMKDPFPPARVAAVLALSATQQYYTLVEVANRALPALSPLTCDPEKQVRDQAFKAIHGFLENLEKASENPELIPELESQVKAGGKSILDSDKVPQWASWALKSLSGKFYKGTPPPAVSKDESGAEETSNAQTATNQLSHQNKPVVSASSQIDGWGEMEESASELDSWEDAPEPKSVRDDDDDWSSGWETPAPATQSQKASAAKKAPLLLNAKKTVVKPVSSPTEESGWDDDFTKECPASVESAKGGWEDDGWGDDSTTVSKPVVTNVSSSLNKDREQRRLEAAARQAARKQELAEKKSARGAMKLGGTQKVLEKKVDDDFADW